MDVEIADNDISLAEVDVIVNAANGCGYHGGRCCARQWGRGVAESLNYYTGGKIEKEAKRKARKYPHISALFFGKKAGEIFETGGHGLRCKTVLHAVTMRYPGSPSNYKTVEILLPKIFEYCKEKGAATVALPLLGAGTGGLDGENIYKLICSYVKNYADLKVFIYSNTGGG